MIIKELYLKNFGKFSREHFSFSDGINLIYGANEAGKTTIYHAIGALLFGLDKQRGRAARSDTYTTYQPWENPTWYEGCMKFESGGKVFSIERSFYHSEKTSRLICETDGEELSVEQGDLEIILGDLNGELFFNTAAVGQLKMKPQEIVYSYLKNYIASVQEAGSRAVDVVKALSILETEKKTLEQQKRRKAAQIQQQIEKADARMELIEKEIADCQGQLDAVRKEKGSLVFGEVPEVRGFFARIFQWFRNLFRKRQLQEEQRKKQEDLLKLEEKINFLRELLGERESLREEMILEKESFFEKLHEQSKDEEIKAIELAMERIKELSALRKEEVMEQLLAKASEVLKQMTKGRYEKLLLEEEEEPAVWDGKRKLKLFQVSTGCADQIYLSLRIALQDLFFGEEKIPLLFDDAFVYFDDRRLERLLLYLNDFGRQVLLFSCQKRELRILERHQIPYGKILL